MFDNYQIIGSNRATGIIYNFLQSIEKDVVWYLPATCCHIVPSCFLKAGRKIYFYDYSLSLEWLLKIKDSSPKGILLVDYNGNQFYSSQDLQNLKQIFKYVIYDKCLSFVDLDFRSNEVDLTVFSTGYSKPVDFNYGGLGIINGDLKMGSSIEYNASDLAELNTCWREMLKGTKSLDELEKVAKKNWLDIGAEQIPFDYQKRIQFYTPFIRKSKEKINQLYKSLIPEELALPADQAIWRYNIYVNNPQVILQELFQKNLFASNHYASCARIFYGQMLPNATLIENHVVNLFNDFRVSESFAEQTGNLIRSLFHAKKITPINTTSLLS